MSALTGKKKLGERVRRARMALEMRQDVLAEKLGVTQGVISNIENGVSTITVPNLQKWATALEQPLLYFIEDETVDIRERALAILSQFSTDQLELVLYMLQSMALGMKLDTVDAPPLEQTLNDHPDNPN